MSTKTNHKAYLKLRKVWYSKLRKQGFIEIENIDSPYEHMPNPSSRWARARYVLEAPARAEYYTLATRFLREYDFESELDKVMWEYHANGLGIRTIAKVLKAAKAALYGKNTIEIKIRALKTAMLKMYVKGK